MRDHEFRVYDPVSASYKEGSYFLGQDGRLWVWSEGGTLVPVEAGSLLVERSTGRLDSRGVLVYEGDLVRARSFDGMDWVGEVGYGECSFFITDGGFTGYAWMDYQVWVVGNIHENPDLLDGDPVLNKVGVSRSIRISRGDLEAMLRSVQRITRGPRYPELWDGGLTLYLVNGSFAFSDWSELGESVYLMTFARNAGSAGLDALVGEVEAAVEAAGYSLEVL